MLRTSPGGLFREYAVQAVAPVAPDDPGGLLGETERGDLAAKLRFSGHNRAIRRAGEVHQGIVTALARVGANLGGKPAADLAGFVDCLRDLLQAGAFRGRSFLFLVWDFGQGWPCTQHEPEAPSAGRGFVVILRYQLREGFGQLRGKGRAAGR